MPQPNFRSRFIGLSPAQLARLQKKSPKAAEEDKEKSPEQILIEAGNQGIPVDIIYRRDDGVVERRTVSPQDIKMYGQTMCLWAFCHTHKETHSFHLHGIFKATKLPDKRRMGPYDWVGPKA